MAAAAYAATLARTLPAGDSGDLIAAAWTTGVPHAPGYPLFTILGRLFAFLPLGEPALRVNLVSLVCGSLAVGLLAALAARLFEREGSTAGEWLLGAAAAAGALALAFSTGFWTYSLEAEVFALNALFAVLLLGLAWWWARRSASVRRFGLLALCGGLALTNQQTIVLLLPALGAIAWLAWRRLPPTAVQLAAGAGLFAAGLLPYLYLPWAAGRNPAFNSGDPSTLASFWTVVTRGEYGSLSLAGPGGEPGSVAGNLAFLGRSFFEAFGPAACALALIGFWALLRTRTGLGVALLLAFLVPGPLFVAFARPDLSNLLWQSVIQRFYVLPSVPFALAITAGALQAATWLRGVVPAMAPAVPAALLLALPLGAAAVHAREADQHDNTIVRDYGHDMLATLESNALLLVLGDMPTFAVDYAQLALGERPDVVKLDMLKLEHPWYAPQLRRLHPDVVIPFDEIDPRQPSAWRALIDANIARRPVYTLGTPAGQDADSYYDAIRAGLASKLAPKSAGADEWSVYAANPALFAGLRFPPHDYPATSFEHKLALDYGAVALDVAFTYQNLDQPDRAIALYRKAIQAAPSRPDAYKNLGILLLARSPNDREVASLWSTYLRLNPADPEAAALRSEIRRLQSTR